MAYNEEESDLDSLMDYMIDQENEAEINNLVNDDLADRVHAEEDMINYCKQRRHEIENNLIGIELDLPSMDYYPHDGNWELFGEAIANNNTLRTLIHGAHMSTKSPSPKQFESFWGRVSTNQSIHILLLRNYDIDGGVDFFTIMQQFLKRICTLELCENSINVKGAQVFGEILSSRDCNLWKLDLCGSVTSNNLWKETCSALNNPHCTLFSLDIQGADIDDECMDVLSYALGNNSHLVWLTVLDCYDITTRGWESLVAPHQSHTSSLKSLSIGAYNGPCGVNDSLAVSFSNALASICEYDVSIVSNEVRSLLELNRNNTASVAARLKVLKAHFSDGNINPFIDMNCKVYPQAISWMAKDRQGLPLLYNFIRSMAISLENVARRRIGRPRDGLAFIASHNGRGRGRHMTIPSWITIPPDRLSVKKNSQSSASVVVSSSTRLACSDSRKKLAMEKIKKKVKMQRLQLMRPFDYGNL